MVIKYTFRNIPKTANDVWKYAPKAKNQILLIQKIYLKYNIILLWILNFFNDPIKINI